VVSLGGRATLIALVGGDAGGQTLRECAQRAGIDLQVVDHGRATLRKTRVVGQQQQIVRLDYEEIQPPEAGLEAAILEHVEAALAACDIVVISDYAKGCVSPTVAQTIIRRAHEVGLAVVVDPRPQHRAGYRGCDYLTPNWKESRALLGLPDAELSPDAVGAVARALAGELGANIVLTLGAHGILFQSRNGREQFAQPTLAREVFDVSGAGDTVVAAFALARAAGADHATAVTVANRAASVVVGKFGTATVTPAELLDETDAQRLLPRAALAPLAATLRAKGKRIVTTNGSFDLLHTGHLHLLTEARQRGDVLIVGLNSDASVRAYKGPTRPIVPERRRAELLLALRLVDYVHIFEEPDPIAFLQELAPDVHVNGSEYGADCIESGTVRQRGGTIHIVTRLPGLSTSGLLDALHASAPAGTPS
jgi:D-beta-D-heptose 7-phosphate kinase/D-beta-D-heptose 1-phosphate adenosyltransferase